MANIIKAENKKFLAVFFSLSLILLLSRPAFAAKEPEEIARIRIKPTFKYSTAYTSNVELKEESSDVKSRIVHNIRPGLIAQIPLERAYIETGYEFGYFKAAGYKWQPTHTGRGLLRYDLSDTTSIGVEDTYCTSTTDFIGSKRYDMNTATAEIKNQAGPRLSTGLKYIFQTYQGPGGEMFADYKDHGGVLSADYRLTPITTLTPSVSFNRRQFQHEEADDSKDYKSYGGSIGISQQLFTRLTGSINGGYVQRDYDQSGIPKEKSATYGAGLAARLTEFSKLDINYQHDIKDTFYALDNSVLLANSPFLLNEAIATLVSTNYRYIETDRIVSNLAYNLTDKDTVNVGFTYLWANSGTENLLPGSPVQDEDLDEKTYTVGLGYSRKLTKWVSLDLNSVYGSRKSNLRGDYDYKSYGGGASLNIAF